MTALAAAVRDAAGYVDRWLAFRRAHLRLPGVQAAVRVDTGDGAATVLSTALSTAHGLADVAAGVALTPAHLFRVASHSKTFTATAVMQLVDAGRLRLDDRLGDVVGWAAGSAVGDRTVAELLAHGGGVTRDGARADHWQLAGPFPDADGLRALLDGADVLPANERFKYSNVGYGLLGAVVAAASGRDYAAHVQEAVVDRAGLVDTTPELPEGRAGDVATGYSGLAYAGRRLPVDQVSSRALASATGFTSTAADLAAWGTAHLPGDERLLSAAARRRMLRQEWTVAGGRGPVQGYGLGFDLGESHGHAAFGHGGGWPGHASRLTVLPDERIAVAVCVNAVDGPAAALAEGVVALADLAAQPARHPVDAGVDRWCGRYASLWGVLDLVRLGERLLGLDPTLDDPSASLVEFAPVAAGRFRAVSAPGLASYGEELVVETGPAGDVVAVRGPGGLTHWPIGRMTEFVATHERIGPGDLVTRPS